MEETNWPENNLVIGNQASDCLNPQVFKSFSLPNQVYLIFWCSARESIFRQWSAYSNLPKPFSSIYSYIFQHVMNFHMLMAENIGTKIK